MCLLDWRLAVISLVFVPLFVWLTRRVGKIRARDHDRAAAPAGRHVLAGRRVAVGVGDHARQDDGPRRATSPTASPGSPKDIADLEVRSRMAGRWLMSTIQMTFAVQPAIVYWLAGQSFDRALDHDRDRRRVHDAADAAAVPDPVAARRRRRHGGLAGAVRPDLRVPRPARRHRRGRPTRWSCARTSCSGRCASRTSRSATARRLGAAGRCATSTSSSRRARGRRSWARPAPARRRSATWSRGCTSRSEGRVTIDGVDVRDA